MIVIECLTKERDLCWQRVFVMNAVQVEGSACEVDVAKGLLSMLSLLSIAASDRESLLN